MYAVAYTLKMSYWTDYKIEGFFEYIVLPLEVFYAYKKRRNRGSRNSIFCREKSIEHVDRNEHDLVNVLRLGEVFILELYTQSWR